MSNFLPSRRQFGHSLNGPQFSGPNTKLLSAAGKRAKAWNFEHLEPRQMMAADFVPNDPYFVFQWPLLNTGGPNIGDQILQPINGTPGEDINVLPAWRDGYSGEGVVIAVVGQGIQIDHPDLINNISQTLAYDARLDLDLTEFPLAGLPNQTIGLEAKGTALAGLIAAEANNNEGIVGVAFGSELVPIKLFDGFQTSSDGTPPEQIVNAFLYENQLIDIYNHGWGPSDFNLLAPSLSQQEVVALRESVINGRGGLGVIHVFEAGDGAGAGLGAFEPPGQFGATDFAGYNPYVNSRYTIGVTGVDHDGEVANEDGTITRYPEAGPSVLVAAPVGSFNPFAGFGVIDDPRIGTGIWTTDFSINPNDPLAEFLDGYNAPTTEELLESNDLVLNAQTGLTLNDRFADAAYTSRFSGTGAAGAMVSGVIALMLEADMQANGGVSTLSYRDVQEILVRSARQNAPFEDLLTGAEKGSGFAPKPETWITNRNEVFHEPGFYIESDVWTIGPDGEPVEVDGDRIPAGTLTVNAFGPFMSQSDFLYHPRFSPDEQPVSLFANGAGYTVSQGRTFIGAEVGYGHGVVDAGLAVELASQWSAKGQTLAAEETFTTFPQNFNWNVPAREVGNEDTGFIIIPGGLAGGSGHGAFYNEYVTDDPFDDNPTFPARGTPWSLEVPVDRDLSLEWAEVKLDLSNGDISELRISLISPEGVHSELNHFFDTIAPPEGFQHFGDVVNFGGLIDDRLGPGPPGTVDPDGGSFFYTFSTNRHWGELTREVVKYDPATGNPYPNSLEFNDGAFVPTAANGEWQLLFENYGTTPLVMNGVEISWHGAPVEENTQRIQGFVGVDQNDDDIFNFDRYIQQYQEIIPETRTELIPLPDPDNEGEFIDVPNSALAPILLFDRLGEIERLHDTSQEQFAENTTVELYSVTASGVETLVDQFVTGDDGNYYFDVVPPVALNEDGEDIRDQFDIDLIFPEDIDPTIQAIFESAADRWESIIIADVPDVDINNIFIDDVVITAQFGPIDGPSGILAQAGPSLFRSDTNIPAAGSMSFDSDDFDVDDPATLASLEDVIVHEMGHVLGIGTVWAELGFLTGQGTDDPRYIGENALREYNSIFGLNDTSVPIDDTGIPGTGSSHWRESVFDNELMTGFINDGANPISTVTIGTLEDIGYTVDYSQADAYTPPTPGAGSGSGGSGGLVTGGIDTRVGFDNSLPDEMIVVPTVAAPPADSGGGSLAADAIVEYIVRVADGEGRSPKADPNAPDGFQTKYKTEWTLDSDYFFAKTREGRAPEFALDEDGEFLFDEFGNLVVEGTTYNELLNGNFFFDPSTDYDVPVDANGDPIPYQSDSIFLFGPQGSIKDHARGINFLLDLPPGQGPGSGFNTVTLEGSVYNDVDVSGDFNAGDVELGSVVVYADLNGNGEFTPGEPSTTTEPSGVNQGQWSISFETTTTTFFQVGVVAPTGFEFSNPDTGLLNAIVSPGDGTLSGFEFGLKPNGATNPDPDPDPNPDPDPDPSTIPGRVGGIVFNDSNSDGVQQGSENGLAGVTVYIDDDGNGQLNGEELFTVTNQFGRYDMSMVPPGLLTVRIIAETPFSQTAPANDNPIIVTLVPNGNRQGISFGVRNLADRDFGDLQGYPTLLSENGPTHKLKPGVFLGATVDGEIDGQPNATATGDDTDANPLDDEDGVTPLFGADGLITAGESLSFEIFVNGIGASLNAWIDFNADGDWTDPGEHIFIDVDVNPGLMTTGNANPSLSLPIVTAPANTASGVPLAARFRLGSSGLSFVGPSDTGEVEDYLFNGPDVDPGGALAGDYDGNGTVEQADYDVWRAAFGNTGAALAADGNGDGIVNIADYTIWRDNLGATNAGNGGSGGGASAAFVEEENSVPSPVFSLDDWYAAARVDTGVGSYNLDSVLASLGLQQSTATLGSGSNTEEVTVIQTVAGVSPADLSFSAISQLLESLGSPQLGGSGGSSTDAGSAAVAAAVAANLDLALEIDGVTGDEDPIELVTNGDEQAEEGIDALATALEEGWTTL